MSSGDKRIATFEDGMPFGTEVISIGPLLQADALDFNIYVPVGMGAIRVKKVRSVKTVTLGAGASTVTIEKQHASEAAVAMTGGTLVLATAEDPGTEDYCDIVNDAKARVPEGDKVVLAIDGTTASGEAVFFIEYERCQ